MNKRRDLTDAGGILTRQPAIEYFSRPLRPAKSLTGILGSDLLHLGRPSALPTLETEVQAGGLVEDFVDVFFQEESEDIQAEVIPRKYIVTSFVLVRTAVTFQSVMPKPRRATDDCIHTVFGYTPPN